MAVDAEEGSIGVADVLEQVGDEAAEFVGQAITSRVRNINDGGPGVDDSFDDFDQVVRVSATGVLG
jgi:hypothetical protein